MNTIVLHGSDHKHEQKVNLQPTNITQMVKIFSASVLGATLPKPTDVNEVNVKYKAVI